MHLTVPRKAEKGITMTTEKYIKQQIPGILSDLGGEATVSDVIHYIKKCPDFFTDSEMNAWASDTRPKEMRWEQAVRNIVAHSRCARLGMAMQKYSEGFAIVADRSGVRNRYKFVKLGEEKKHA